MEDRLRDLKELVFFGLKAGELIAGIADGIDFSDVSKLIAAGKSAGPAFKDAKNALAEYSSMSDEEAKGLEDYVTANFDIADDKVEAGIKGALNVAIELHGLVGLITPKA